MAAAQFGQRTDQVVLGGIALPALPEAQHPFRHHGRFARQAPVAGNHLVVIVTDDKIVVLLRFEFRPERELLVRIRRLRRSNPQADVRHVAVGFPFDPDRSPPAFFQVGRKLVTVRIPGRPPAAGHHFLPVKGGLLETRIILDERIIGCFGRFDKALIDDPGAVERHSGQIADGRFVFVKEAVFTLDQRLAPRRDIGSRQGTFHAVLVIKTQHFAQLPVRLGIAPAGERVGIEEDSVAAGGDHEENTYFRIVLVQLFPSAPVVEFAGLVLAEPVERIRFRRFKLRQDRPRLLVFHLDGFEGRLAVLQERRPVCPVKIDGSIPLVHFHDQAVRRQTDLAHGCRHFKIFTSFLGHDCQALSVCKRAARNGRYPDDAGCDHLKPDYGLPAGNHDLTAFAAVFATTRREQHKQKKEKYEFIGHQSSISV